MTGVDVLDAQTVRINLSEPFAPLVALLANRPGVMLLFNLDHGAAADTPFGKDVRIRQAFAKSIDRASLN